MSKSNEKNAIYFSFGSGWKGLGSHTNTALRKCFELKSKANIRSSYLPKNVFASFWTPNCILIWSLVIFWRKGHSQLFITFWLFNCDNGFDSWNTKEDEKYTDCSHFFIKICWSDFSTKKWYILTVLHASKFKPVAFETSF